MMVLFLILLVIFGAGLAWPFWREARKPAMGAESRQSAPGDFVQLSRGLTHYQWLGATQGPVAVCVHGLTTPSYVWGPIAEGLGRMGFRVLVYDLYGRGYSDRPQGAQDPAFFVSQLEELLEALDIQEEFTLLGYSMGGAIAASFGVARPSRLRQMVLLAPAGMGHDLGPIERLTNNYGSLGTWLMMALYERAHRQGTEVERDLHSTVDNIVDRQQAELNYRGFVPAVLASLRGMLDSDQEQDHRAIHKADIPVLAIWGEEDEVIPIAGKDRLADWNPSVRHEVIEGAGHGLAYTHTDEVLHAMQKLNHG